MHFFWLTYIPAVFHFTRFYSLIFIFLFAIIPFMDAFIPVPNRISKKSKIIERSLLYPWAIVIILSLLYTPITGVSLLSEGVLLGQGINIAHELIHRHTTTDNIVAYFLLEVVGYGHFRWQHILGHHKNVGLEIDPVTSPKGINVYQFWIRSIVGSIKQAWELNSDEFIRATTRTLCYFSVSWYFGRLMWHLGASMIAILFLETINYIEHYGITRKVGEPVTEHHSWDSSHPWSNYLLFRLPSHSDHHLHPQKTFRELEIMEKSPKLPYGYPIMVILALIPPLYPCKQI